MKSSLKKSLTLLDVFCVATGAMISSGLFILPGLAFAKAGPAVIFILCYSRNSVYSHTFEYGGIIYSDA
jgi:amino acid permease